MVMVILFVDNVFVIQDGMIVVYSFVIVTYVIFYS